MLTHLHIENYAIIEHLDIDLAASLNTITGETGAGKSILLGALGMLAGGKADAAVIGVNGENCIVEGSFKIDGYNLKPLFEKLEIDWEPVIDIRRVVSRSGKSRAFIGDAPVNLASVREVVDKLVDIHSQHQTLLLAHQDFQREIVDAVAQNSGEVQTYTDFYNQYTSSIKQLSALKAAQKNNAERGEWLAFQIEHLQGAKIELGEQSQVEAELNELTHAEQIGSGLSSASDAMQNDEAGALGAIKSAIGALHKIEAHLAKAEELAKRMESAYIELKDITAEVDDTLDNIEVNPRQVEILQQRIDEIYTLCKKHNVENGDCLPDILKNFEAEYDTIENSAENIEKLERQIAELKGSAVISAGKLTKSRVTAVAQIEKYVVSTLKKLGIKSPRIEVQISPQDLNAYGADAIKFLFSANDGAAMQDIASAASGGEMSRLMLSIKALVAGKLRLPTIIFDEIDSGVSGAVADAMGDIIYSLSASMQVINITHLPQVASKGETHFKVYKDKATHIVKLNKEERIEQIAAMISGAEVTDAARTQAEELLKTRTLRH